MDFEDLQAAVRPWAQHNFGDVPSWQPLLGAVEELGELAHAHLKRAQGIRGTTAQHRAKQIDAVGDIIIYLADYCNRESIDMAAAVESTWQGVRERDWKANPETGKVA